jgi:hypothetical protein
VNQVHGMRMSDYGKTTLAALNMVPSEHGSTSGSPVGGFPDMPFAAASPQDYMQDQAPKFLNPFAGNTVRYGISLVQIMRWWLMG